MEQQLIYLLWGVSIAVGTAWAATSHRSRWITGALCTILLGPLGLLLIAWDMKTWKPSADAQARR